jgi:hypothetical protein
MDNNPLKQFFRRPAVYLKLPSGGKDYATGVIDMPPTGELPIYPMTAIDEITAKTPDALFNGTAVSELMRSCVPNIKDPWSVNSNDLDAILIGIKAASTPSGVLEIESTCPSCEDTSTYGINLVGVLSTMKSGDYSEELTLGDLAFKFRPITYKEMNSAAIGQFEIQKMFSAIAEIQDEKERELASQEALRKITDLTMEVLSQALEYIKTPSTVVDQKAFILDFLKNCDKNIYFEIRDHNAMLKTGTELKPIDIKCVSCNHEYAQPFTLNPSDFFD